MKALLAVILMWMSISIASAHPGWGIVEDSKHNLYFTDTQHVWRISPDGTVTKAVADVHTHELWIDDQDVLYGEHLRYIAGQAQPWRHRVWQRSPNGTVRDVVRERPGFLNDYSFVRDASGNMYWADRGRTTSIKKRARNGRIGTHAVGDFRSVERMTALPDGTLFVMDAGGLKKISPSGQVTTIKARLSARNPPPANVSRLNYHMGLWTDASKRVYVASATEKRVLRIDEASRVSVVATSVAPWAPSGGVFARDGTLWVLEFDPKNAVRVRRIDRRGRSTYVAAPQLQD
jgi:hypothetical protein